MAKLKVKTKRAAAKRIKKTATGKLVRMKANAETSLAVLKDVLPLLEVQEDYSNDALYALLSDYVAKKEVKNGYVMWPIRTAVSGKQMTPGGATEIMEVLQKEETIKRIKAAIEKLG